MIKSELKYTVPKNFDRLRPLTGTSPDWHFPNVGTFFSTTKNFTISYFQKVHVSIYHIVSADVFSNENKIKYFLSAGHFSPFSQYCWLKIKSVLKRLSMMIINSIRTLALLIIVCNLVTGVVEAIGYFRGLKRLVNVRFNSPMKNDRKCHLRHVYFELLCHSTVKSWK